MTPYMNPELANRARLHARSLLQNSGVNSENVGGGPPMPPGGGPVPPGGPINPPPSEAGQAGQPTRPPQGPRPQDMISMGQLSSVPDYVARFLIDLGRKTLGLPEGGGMPMPQEGGAGGGPMPMPMEGRQFGGGTSTAQPYLVGEQGPELFVPERPGQIVPNPQTTRNQRMANWSQSHPGTDWSFGGHLKMPGEDTYNKNMASESWSRPMAPTYSGEGTYQKLQRSEPWAQGNLPIPREGGGYVSPTQRPPYVIWPIPRQEGGDVSPSGEDRGIIRRGIPSYPPTPPSGPSYAPSEETLRIARDVMKPRPGLPTWSEDSPKNINYPTERESTGYGPSQKTIQNAMVGASGIQPGVTDIRSGRSYNPQDITDLQMGGDGSYGVPEREQLPSGETRYNLPGTEGSMTLPKGWNPAEEGQKLMGRMKEGGVYGGYGEPYFGPPAPARRSYYDVHPEERAAQEVYDMAGNKNLAAAIYGRALEYGPGTPGSQEKLAHAEYLRQQPGIQLATNKMHWDTYLEATKERQAERRQESTDKAETAKSVREEKLYERILAGNTSVDPRTGEKSYNWDNVGTAIRHSVAQGVLSKDYLEGLPEGPPVKGAKLAPDGKWYVPDPKRKGKYLRVGD